MKKFLSLALAAAMAVGTCVGFAGCDSGKNNDDNSGNNNGNNNNPPAGSDTKTELLTNIANADISYLTLDANVDISIKTDGDTEFGGKETVSAKADLSDLTNPALDLVASVDSVLEGNMYAVVLMRDGYAYTTDGDWDSVGVEAGDLDGLLNVYRSSDTLGFERNRVGSQSDYDYAQPTSAQAVTGGQLASLPYFSTAIKLVGNLAEVVGCELKSVSGGYSIDFDLVKSANAIVDGVNSVLEKASPDTKVNDVIANSYISGVLSTLLKGISAQDFFTVAQSQAGAEVYQAMTKMLPAPGSQSLFDYLKNVVNDKTFYAMFVENMEFPTTATCFGELTVRDIVKLAAGTEVADDDINGTIGMVKAIVTSLKNDLVGTITGLIAGGKGTGSVDKVAVSLLFDSSKKFTGIDVAVAGLNMTATTEHYHESTSGDVVTSTSTTEITASGSASVKLVNNVSLASLNGLKYKTDEQNTNVFEESHFTYNDTYTFHLATGTMKDFVDITVPVTYELTVTEDKVSATISIPDFKIKSGDNFLPLENATGSLSLSAIKNATSERPATTLISGSSSNTVIFYNNVMYVCTISLRGFAWDSNEGVHVELCYGSGGLQYLDSLSVYYQSVLAPIA